MGSLSQHIMNVPKEAEMAERRQWKIRPGTSLEHEIADYSNLVAVTAGEHEVVLLFSQVVTPVDDTGDAVAKPVAKVAVPYPVAGSMCKILTNMLKKEK